MHKTVPVVLSVLTASLFAAGSASAFHVRTTETGTPVHWDADTITVIADPSLAQLGPHAVGAATRAFAAWSAVQGASAPGVVLTEGLADEVGYRDGDDNKSTLRYEPDGYAPAGGALAITVLTFDGAGKIVDADIVINGGGSHGFAILPDGAGKGPGQGQGEGHDTEETGGGSYDVEDVLTHEAGHFFGLAHNDGELDATMYYATARGETKKRDLSPDDEAGIRSLYLEPRSTVTAACSASPGNGTGATAPGVAGVGLLATAILAARRRRRRRPQDL
jgi:hypothetical protein